MNKIETFIERSVHEALKHQQNDIVFIPIRLVELETIIEKSVSRALQLYNNSPREISEYGGIALAEEITGYKKQSIYQMVSSRQIPFIKKNGKLFFSKQDLLKWLQEGRRGTLEEFSRDTRVGKM